MTYTAEQKKKAIQDCRDNGEDPFGWLDYADLRNEKRRWEYFLPKESGGLS